MEFPTNIKCFFENNALHDYEVGQISINYSNGTIILNLISDKCEMIELTIEHFKSISFTKDEPWGKGKYIVSSDAKKENGEFILEFQLNSGDSCTMTFTPNGSASAAHKGGRPPKLSAVQIADIRARLRDQDCNKSQLAREYGVTYGTILKISKAEV